MYIQYEWIRGMEKKGDKIMTDQETMDTAVLVKMTRELKDKLEKIAKRKGIGISTLIRLWALEHVEEEESSGEKEGKKTTST